MEANVWWLLAIPLFFGLGWLAARLDASQILTETRALPRSYFNGLNYLLAEQPDKAIVAFEEVARLDPETAELYFALGQLFRRRGEPDRAIRIHKNLLQRADLPATAREHALFELAQDFLAAGIFDHAENAFRELAGTRYSAQAQRELAKLYEKEANWSAAIACAKAFLASDESSKDADKVKQDLSHYGCELAGQHFNQKDINAAQAALNEASVASPSNPRLPFLQAQLAFARGNSEQALHILSAAVVQEPKLCPLALQTALQGLGSKPKGTQLDTLFAWASQAPSASATQILTNVLVEAGRDADLNTLLGALSKQLSQTPQSGSMLAISSLWTASQAQPLSAQQQQYVEGAAKAATALAYRYDRPMCTVCGFKATRHHWRCPGCGSWCTLPYSA